MKKDDAIEILLVCGNLRKEVSGLKARQIVSLCDKEVVELGEEKTGIYKYQSGDSVMREVMACYCQQPAALRPGSSWGQGDDYRDLFSREPLSEKHPWP